ncbi:hypothetical protein [Cedecea sp. MMO-103]|uniref:hypothetical protein n=1 Tax=Cedecea sp. MMO-103 TaxID=3081238 RepID=UPI00301A53F0
MKNLSNERLKQHIDNPLESGLSRSEVMDALRELLALREAGKEPVGFRWRHESHHHDNAWSYVTHRTMPDAFESQQVVQYLYAAPQLPAVPEGWVMVPTEATSAMLNAAWISHGIHHPSAWRTMIGAAPKPEA